jgi:hypothetical protein
MTLDVVRPILKNQSPKKYVENPGVLGVSKRPGDPPKSYPQKYIGSIQADKMNVRFTRREQFGVSAGR